MPSLSNAIAVERGVGGAGCVEWVRPRDTPRESRYVLIAVLGILILGTVALLFVRQERAQIVPLPVALTGLTTQLSNARDEIQLLQELGMLDPRPDLAALTEAELPPFARPDLAQLEPGCLVFDLDPYLVRFQQAPLRTEGGEDGREEAWEIAWLDEREVPGIAHATHLAGEGESPCEDHGEWRRYTAALE